MTDACFNERERLTRDFIDCQSSVLDYIREAVAMSTVTQEENHMPNVIEHMTDYQRSHVLQHQLWP